MNATLKDIIKLTFFQILSFLLQRNFFSVLTQGEITKFTNWPLEDMEVILKV